MQIQGQARQECPRLPDLVRIQLSHRTRGCPRPRIQRRHRDWIQPRVYDKHPPRPPSRVVHARTGGGAAGKSRPGTVQLRPDPDGLVRGVVTVGVERVQRQ